MSAGKFKMQTFFRQTLVNLRFYLIVLELKFIGHLACNANVNIRNNIKVQEQIYKR